MANLYFYAVQEDIRVILDFVFENTDCRVFESDSIPDQNLREFTTTEDLISALDIGSDPHGQGVNNRIALWSPSFSPEVKIRRIDLDPKRCAPHKFRFTVEGWGLLYLSFGGIFHTSITHSCFTHNSEKRARTWESVQFDKYGAVDEWDWNAVQKLSGKISYLIRRKLASSKIEAWPILEFADKMYRENYSLKMNSETYSSND